MNDSNAIMILFHDALRLFKQKHSILFDYVYKKRHRQQENAEMTRRSGKNDSLEALDFIISVLKEHEKDLDRLIGELGKVTSKLGAGGEMNHKVERVEERLSTIQGEVANLIKELSTPKEASAVNLNLRGPPVIVRCKQWDDFKALATGAETVSFLMKEPEKSFQADALKNGRVLTYNGEYPRDARLLKLWIARELAVEEQKVFEGVLAIG
jgi:archaellum component FlaC